MHKTYYITLILVISLLLVACNRNREPSPATVEATETPTVETPTAEMPATVEADTEATAQPESPLSQPESPLSEAFESPLPTPAPAQSSSLEEATPAGPPYVFLSDMDAIVAIAAETTPSEPMPDSASLSAVLYSSPNGTVVPRTLYYLTSAVETDDGLVPPYLITGPDEDFIGGHTGAEGQIDLDNIPPGNYYLLVETVYSWLFALEEEDSEEPLLITVEEGDQLDLDLVYVNWP